MFSMAEFDQEAHDRRRRREGYEEGAQQKAVEDATNMLREDISPEKAARCTGLPLEQVLELKEQIAAPAQA